jgi:hypothetical protein
MKITKLKNTLPAVVLLCVIGGMLFRYFSTKVSEDHSTEVTTLLQKFADAEEKYYKTHNEYSSDKEQLELSYSSNNIEVYFTPQNFPDEYIKQIHENTVPYISKKSFKLMGIYKDLNSHKIYMWTIDSRKTIDYIGYLSY